MKTEQLAMLLSENSYPGRGIVIGRSDDGEHAVIAYFIMGRSENSRNRVFVEQGDGIRTQAFDPSKLTDPSLIIYAPVRVFRNEDTSVTIVTNGDQTDTIYDAFAAGNTFEDALRTRTFEPDAPNYTPRISGGVEGFDYKLSILKSADGDPSSTRRYFYEYRNPLAGQGHFIHTYRCDGNPIPSFEGEPEQVELVGDIDEFTDLVWNNLNPDNKVSLFTRYINVKTGEVQTRIVNKNQ
ncbi:IMP cyclohydrolase [Clostridiaceae bacterium NSJ-31]|uniref:IMP cyclohydrolase n=1 Tax=Ligaoa zhengdingensis TaxID=2763658 RepID=A0A926I5B1_9FIRM|nr:IMP cyclohydrolase [Ligaoa zhengdingensis]MBC8547280.1 IMP cyclohydrolase [Ligaoa zhengdingensis]